MQCLIVLLLVAAASATWSHSYAPSYSYGDSYGYGSPYYGSYGGYGSSLYGSSYAPTSYYGGSSHGHGHGHGHGHSVAYVAAKPAVSYVSQPAVSYVAPRVEKYVAPAVSYVAKPAPVTYAAPAVSYVSKPAPVTYVAPRVQKYVAPAVSYVAKPAPVTYAAPAVSYVSKPAPVTYVAPRVEKYVAPAVSYVAKPAPVTYAAPAVSYVSQPAPVTYVAPRVEKYVAPAVSYVSKPAPVTYVAPRVEKPSTAARPSHMTFIMGSVAQQGVKPAVSTYSNQEQRISKPWESSRISAQQDLKTDAAPFSGATEYTFDQPSHRSSFDSTGVRTSSVPSKPSFTHGGFTSQRSPIFFSKTVPAQKTGVSTYTTSDNSRQGNFRILVEQPKVSFTNLVGDDQTFQVPSSDKSYSRRSSFAAVPQADQYEDNRDFVYTHSLADQDQASVSDGSLFVFPSDSYAQDKVNTYKYSSSPVVSPVVYASGPTYVYEQEQPLSYLTEDIAVGGDNYGYSSGKESLGKSSKVYTYTSSK